MVVIHSILYQSTIKAVYVSGKTKSLSDFLYVNSFVISSYSLFIHSNLNINFESYILYPIDFIGLLTQICA